MSRLSYKLSSALAKGRQSRRLTREQILVDLLNKRAAARRAGLRDLERALREQIRWALPLRHARDDEKSQEPAESEL
ncbi:MAG TPA: hypothetical protein VH331_06170 [Allosphingosinicella sp.]|jgi:hypothetical protein|nr:hypothetical protein [Allosphingosinicella sp.]